MNPSSLPGSFIVSERNARSILSESETGRCFNLIGAAYTLLLLEVSRLDDNASDAANK
jgi:hypothetical protein